MMRRLQQEIGAATASDSRDMSHAATSWTLANP